MLEFKGRESLRRFFDDVFLLGIYKRHGDVEQTRKLVLVNTITLLAIVILLMVGTISYYKGHILVGTLDLSAAAVLLGCIYILRRTEKHQVPIYVGMSIMTALYFFLFVTGGAGNTGHLWYYTYPLFTLYIMGRRDGSIFNAILLVPSFIYLIMIWTQDTPHYSQNFIVRFIPSMLCIFIFSYLFETTRQKTYRKLRDKQTALEHSIGALRQKEAELQAAHDDLESQVDARTRELKKSNEELINEIAERKNLERQLVRAQKMEAIGTLAGGVAHDLNNILSGITTYPELLLTDLDAESPIRRPLEIIRNSGEKAATIVQDLLTLSRRSTAVFQSVNLEQVICDYLASPEFNKMISFHDRVSVETNFDAPHLTISGSVVHLSKTIMNLVTNAAEAMPAGGRVNIELKEARIQAGQQMAPGLKPGHYVRLTVSDSGTGMSADVLDRIFEPFFTTKQMGRSGTGLGMAVVWGTVQDHEGHIEIRSKPEEGTSFDLYLPVSDAISEPASDVPASLPKGNEASILVVDDVAEQCQITSDILEQLGYRVQTASSGEGAVAYLQDDHADLVVLDMTMNPGIDGLETFRRILEFKPRQRVIITSGYSESAKIRETLRLGAKSYLRKPFSMDALAMSVHKALAS